MSVLFCIIFSLFLVCVFRYFFKKKSDDFGEGAVFEEVKEDCAVVPTWEGKIVARLQKVD